VRASVELLPDAAAGQWVQDVWQRLVDAGLPSRAEHQGLTNWPHVTVWESGVHVADRPGVPRPGVPEHVLPPTEALASALDHLPVTTHVLGPAHFGRPDRTVLVLELDPGPLADLHAQVAGAAEQAGVGAALRRVRWRPHLTLSKALSPEQATAAERVVGDHDVPAQVVLDRLRTWDPAANRTVDVPLPTGGAA